MCIGAVVLVVVVVVLVVVVLCWLLGVFSALGNNFVPPPITLYPIPSRQGGVQTSQIPR